MTIKKLIQNLKKRDLREFKIFYEMIVIPLKTKGLKFNELERNFLNMLDYNKKEFFEILRKKIRMMIEEFKCFLEIIEDYEKFTFFYLKEFRFLQKIKNIQKDKKEKEINNILEKQKHYIGENDLKEEKDLNQINIKNEKNLKEELKLNNKIYNSEMRLMRLEELLSLLGLVLNKIQIPEMKKRKKKRFSKIINIFSHQQLSYLEQELSFWETIESFTEN